MSPIVRDNNLYKNTRNVSLPPSSLNVSNKKDIAEHVLTNPNPNTPLTLGRMDPIKEPIKQKMDNMSFSNYMQSQNTRLSFFPNEQPKNNPTINHTNAEELHLDSHGRPISKRGYVENKKSLNNERMHITIENIRAQLFTLKSPYAPIKPGNEKQINIAPKYLLILFNIWVENSSEIKFPIIGTPTITPNPIIKRIVENIINNIPSTVKCFLILLSINNPP